MSTSIDLHLHTTASDGRCAPDELVRRAFAAGIRIMSVTDHDTRAGESLARTAAVALGIEIISGIEITTVDQGKDVHVLAYGLPPDPPPLETVLAEQRSRRLARAREIASRLASLGAPIDIDAVIASGRRSGKTVARPQIAQCLVDAGHASSIGDAFDRYLDERAAAYVPHQGISPAEMVALIVQCGGVASLAHPGRLNKDHLIGALVDAGLQCIEAYHSSHGDTDERRYLETARHFGLAVTGGSDFHGDGTRHAELFGVIGLPEVEFARFRGLLDGAPLQAAV